MLRAQIQAALEAARKASQHTEFVIAGSLSVLGLIEHPPEAMSMSIDIDFYPLRDPARAALIADELGEGSEFHDRNGYYLDAISPDLPTLPNGWQERMVRHQLGSVTAFFLDVNDTAVSKYARGAENDHRWIAAGIDAGILDLDAIGARMRRATHFYDDDEKLRALGGFSLHVAAIDKDGKIYRPVIDAIDLDSLSRLRHVDAEEGCYVGEISWVDQRYAVQRSEPDGLLIVHRLDSWSDKPRAGQYVEVRYTEGIASLKAVHPTRGRGSLSL